MVGAVGEVVLVMDEVFCAAVAVVRLGSGFGKAPGQFCSSSFRFVQLSMARPRPGSVRSGVRTQAGGAGLRLMQQ